MSTSIVLIQRTVRYYDGYGYRPGEALTMADGSVWFHPYSGGAPVCVIKPERDR